jgi:hypothetical protein
MSTRKVRCTTIATSQDASRDRLSQAPAYEEVAGDYDPYIVQLLRKLERTPPSVHDSRLLRGLQRAARLEAQPPLDSPAADVDVPRRLGDWSVPDLPPSR